MEEKKLQKKRMPKYLQGNRVVCYKLYLVKETSKFSKAEKEGQLALSHLW